MIHPAVPPSFLLEIMIIEQQLTATYASTRDTLTSSDDHIDGHDVSGELRIERHIPYNYF